MGVSSPLQHVLSLPLVQILTNLCQVYCSEVLVLQQGIQAMLGT